jgi:hypothetical protein
MAIHHQENTEEKMLVRVELEWGGLLVGMQTPMEISMDVPQKTKK